jgi:predicted dinucleotide-binding enzyme
VEPLAGKPVLDTINYIAQRDERIPGLGGSLSSSEVLQRHLGTAHVVEVFSNITFWHLASVARAAARPNVGPCRSPGMTRPRRRC